MFKWNLVQAKSIMMKKVITVYADACIYDAMDILVKEKISGLPVVNTEGNLVGIVTEKDVMRLLFTGAADNHKCVADCMTKDVVSFHPEDSVVDICALFITKPFRRVPIIEDGKLVGVVARRDIVSLLLTTREDVV